MGEIGIMISRLQHEGYDLDGLIDEELRLAGFLGLCDRATKSLSDRADAIAGEHTALKSLLNSIDAQLKQLQDENSYSFIEIEEPSQNRTINVLGKEHRPKEKTVIIIDDDETDETSNISSQSSSEGNQVAASRAQTTVQTTSSPASANQHAPSAVQQLQSFASKQFMPQSSQSGPSSQCTTSPQHSPQAMTQLNQKTNSQHQSPPPTSSSQRTVLYRRIRPAPNISMGPISPRSPVSPVSPTPFKSPVPISPRSTEFRTLNSPGSSGGSFQPSRVTAAPSRSSISPQQTVVTHNIPATRSPTLAVTSESRAIMNPPVASVAETEAAVSPSQVSLPPPPPPVATTSTAAELMVATGPPKFDVRVRVIGKRPDELWYSGVIDKILSDKYSQVRYKVKFDKGTRGLLSSNHIALETNPSASILNVGSRVVALRPRDTAEENASWRNTNTGLYGKLDVLYAGIVAEKACNENKNRFLIFFDDGFAQYLPVKKLHHVYHTGKKVWDDVAEHSREFIQEYLEEFPARPMVKVKAGQWVKTEWRGQWLKAKVLQLDCSLIKMLFQIDNRSEWIYRGSTRLEPLYSALIDGKISTAKKSKRSRKMTRTSLSKGNEPFIDYGITKPCFGVCLYSNTDPKGEQQRQMEEKRQQTLHQQQLQEAGLRTSSATSSTTSSAASSTGNSTGGRNAAVLTSSSSRTEASSLRSGHPVGATARSLNGQTTSSVASRPSAGHITPTDAGTQHLTTQQGRDLPQVSAPRTVKQGNQADYDAVKQAGTAQKVRQNAGNSQSGRGFPARQTTSPSGGTKTLAVMVYERGQAAPVRNTTAHAPVDGGSAVLSTGECPGGRCQVNNVVAQAPAGSRYRPGFTNDSTASIKASHMRKRTNAGFVSVQSSGVEVIDLEAEVQVENVGAPLINNEPLLHKQQRCEQPFMPEDLYDSWRAPWLRKNRRDIRSTGSNRAPAVRLPSNGKRKQDMASLIEARLRNGEAIRTEVEPDRPLVISKSIKRGPHKCGPDCVQTEDMSQEERTLHNSLAIPLLLGWRREMAQKHPGNKKEVYYRAACNRRLRSTGEVARYLSITQSTHVTIDQFSFDARVSCHDIPVGGPMTIIPDISRGKERIPVPVVNLLDNSFPPAIDYITERSWSAGVHVVLDPGFLACCDCTDNCQDKTKCSCAQLTISTSATIDGKEDENCGYEYRRLKDCVTTGIYECNQNCACSSRCFNRVVQNGLQCRLQVFKTENRGWGLRAVDDIPAGAFVCTYSGQILNEDMANKEGKDFGDEYFAELDHIEIVEKAKEGYESNVSELEEDDSVILERLAALSSASDSGCDRSCSSDTDTSETESVVSVGSNLSNRSGSRGFEGLSGGKIHKRKKRKKSVGRSSKKMKGVLGQESLVVERESKAHSLSHIADEKWCILALKRNHDDPNAAAAFLTEMMNSKTSDQTSEAVSDMVEEDWNSKCSPVLTSDQRLRAVTDEENNTQSSDFDFDDVGDALESDTKARAAASITERTTAESTETATTTTTTTTATASSHEDLTCELNVKQVASTKRDMQDVNSRSGSSKEDDVSSEKPETPDKPVDSPDSAPPLLSAVDLSRLAAQKPKHDEGPPVLVKMNPRRQVPSLEDMITRLKTRVLVEMESGASRQEKEQGGTNSAQKELTVSQPSGDKPLSSDKDCELGEDYSHDSEGRAAHVGADVPPTSDNERSRAQPVEEAPDNLRTCVKSGAATEPQVLDEPMISEDILESDGKPGEKLSEDCSLDKPVLDDPLTVESPAQMLLGEVKESNFIGNSHASSVGKSYQVEGKSLNELSLNGSIEEKIEDKSPNVRMELVSDISSEVADESFPPSPASFRSDLSRAESIDRRSEVSTDDSRTRHQRGKPAVREPKVFKVKIRQSNKPPGTSPERSLSRQSSVSSKKVSTRSYFGDEHCYVIDAKAYGNCGRYLNHSCSPNLFVQNVFVDTHDLRFPWVAFFAQHYIPAGSELTWDYMYEVGSVQDKVLHCYCGSAECRGRLL